MDRNTLNEAVQARLDFEAAKYAAVREALQLLYSELNQGQQKKVLKDENVKEMLTEYGLI